MTLERNVDWDKALQLYLDSKREADEACAYFAAGGVEAITGEDLTKRFRGRLTWVRDHLAEAVDEVLEPRPVAFARAGDVVMLDGNLGVCNGDQALFMALYEGQTGTTSIPTLECEKAWTVG